MFWEMVIHICLSIEKIWWKTTSLKALDKVDKIILKQDKVLKLIMSQLKSMRNIMQKNLPKSIQMIQHLKQITTAWETLENSAWNLVIKCVILELVHSLKLTNRLWKTSRNNNLIWKVIGLMILESFMLILLS